MDIVGVTVTKKDNFVVCFIDEFSEELKSLLRNELTSICHGRNQVKEYNLDRYSYKKTLSSFFERYNGKTKEIKKGMMGELIAHLLIDKVLTQLQTITIYFNKEELSIRKGFDLTYVEMQEHAIWYGEVKSGEINNDTETPDIKNKDLLHNSKSSLLGFLSGERSNIWDSVLIDVGLSIASKERETVSRLLDNDAKQMTEKIRSKKNAILISVLFHDTNQKMTVEHLEQLIKDITDECCFDKVILFSIQKSTYIKIEKFLEKEVISQDSV